MPFVGQQYTRLTTDGQAKSGAVWLPRGFEFLDGFPEARRRRSTLLILKAHFDDSGTKGTGRVLIIGGLLGTAEVIAEISDQWDRELRGNTPLSLPYFKADDATGLEGAFDQWRPEARDEKVRRMAAIIDRDDVLMLFSGVDLYAHERLEAIIGRSVTDAMKHFFNQPYILALLSVMMGAGLEAQQRNATRIETIFDIHESFKAVVKQQWDVLLEVLPEPVRHYMPVEPWFRDDKEFMTLQAADLIAGHARRTIEKDPVWKSIGVNLGRLRASAFSRYYGANELRQMVETSIKRPLKQTQLPQFNVPIDGDGWISGEPLMYRDMDQPLVSRASRASLPPELARWVRWN